MRAKGFTLVELLVVMAIIGILAGIAYPSYMESVRKSNRSDATSELQDIAVRLQRCYTLYTSYDPGDGRCAIVDQLKADTGVKSKGGFYTIKGSNFARTTYTLSATAVAGKTQASDGRCALFSLTQAGVKNAKDSGGNNAGDYCW